MYHFIEDKPKCPNIAFRRILFSFEHLETHVQGSSNNSLIFNFGSILAFLCESKIPDFKHTVFDHDIGRFQIPRLKHQNL